MEGALPVRVKNEEGQLSKVDLGLEKTSSGWVPANPLVEVAIASSAEEGVEVGDDGLMISQAGAEDSTARPLGDKNVFFGEVKESTDTDLLVSPISGGVELFNMLRSVDSPETLRFHMDMPQGAELRPTPSGGAEVAGQDGSMLAEVPAPRAADAQGRTVPVTLEVDGDSLVLSLNHREEEVAYPILVDPEVIDNWYYSFYNNQSLWTLGAWGYQENQNGWLHHGTSDTSWPGHGGLFFASQPGSLPGGQWGQYLFSAPNATSYFEKGVLVPFWRNNRNCTAPNPYPEPYDYDGMWYQGHWNESAVNLPDFNQANQLGYADLSWGQTVIFGMSTSNGIYIPCWRDLGMMGLQLWLNDWNYPYVSSVSGVPSGWVKKGTNFTIGTQASDEGLGVQTVRAFGVGTPEWLWNQPWCAGTFENSCGNNRSGQITVATSGFPYEGRYNGEGKERKFSVQAIDPTDKRWALERSLWLDGTPPVVSLEGQLAAVTKQIGTDEKPQEEGNDELSLPTYRLEVEADDGGDRSGVKEIKVFLDGKATPEEIESASCSTNCPQKLSMSYTLRLPDLSPGTHSLRIVAVDKVGNESDPNRDIEFEYIPATGMKEEYVLQHFRLPDGSDYSDEAEYHGPEIAVNVMNGNVVFHERDFKVEADRANLELERVYNSQQPAQKDTQWGRGWSAAQAPELEPQPGPSPPQKATVTQMGKITSAVPIPQAQAQTTFSSRLHANITKTTAGYEVAPVSEPEVSVFNDDGRIEEVVLGDNTPVYLEPEEVEAISPSPPDYISSFGTNGSGNGQLNRPADAAVDAQGNVWVADRQNNRIQKFSPSGEYLSQFGSQGSANGQLSGPRGIATDAQGNVWVADGGNRRVQKFSSNGEFLLKFGSQGTGNGQFSSYGPKGIAIDAQGNAWVSDYSNRVQKFNAAGEFVKIVGAGLFGESAGLDAGGGKVWVGDWTKNQVRVFSEAGDHLFNVGAQGSGPGQFSHPDAVEVDTKGNIWVGDEGNSRVQQLNQQGEYITQFGAAGSGEGQFKFAWPFGLTSDDQGRIWIADSNNHRVQRWSTASIGFIGGSGPAPYFEAPVVDYEYTEGMLTGLQLEDEATEEEDPSLDMTLSSGLVSDIDSEDVGNTAYEYESSSLKTVEGEDGETKYGYDSSGRLNSVTLPNETLATITYDSTSRATSVKVDPAGPETAKTTNFSYSTEPRRTVVWGGGNPEITYDLGEDGSVLKWSYAETPPTISSISGSLWAKRGEEIENKDHTLFVTGSSPHQVASIRVVANGTAVVAEKTCEDPSEPPSHVCDQPAPLEWITHAAEHQAGRMDLEVIVTDFLGHQTAERFFVFVPQQPPADPTVAERPNFNSIKLFREEYGLDRNEPLSDVQLNELILELLYEWENRDPTVMRAVEGWGIPMRAPELAEMEWRRQFVDQAAEAIPQWAEENAHSLYGGFYVDERTGSKIYVGFTENQASLVDALKQSGVLINPSQVFPYPVPPVRSVVNLEATEGSVAAAIAGNPTVSQATVFTSTSPEGNVIEVGATNPALVESFLKQQFGQGAPIEVVADNPGTRLYSRFGQSGPLYAGSAIVSNATHASCTAGWSARAPGGAVRGRDLYKYFLLTAGHCFDLNGAVARQFNRSTASGTSFGVVRRQAFAPDGPSDKIITDAEAILISSGLRSHSVLNGSPMVPQPIQGSVRPRIRRTVCWSAVYGGQHCGRIIRKLRSPTGVGDTEDVTFLVNGPAAEGDSGGPVWDLKTHKAVGLIAVGLGDFWITSSGARMFERMTFTPLRPRPNESIPQGALPRLGVSVLGQG